MPKRKNKDTEKQKTTTQAPDELDTQTTGEQQASDTNQEQEQKPRYAFPTVSRCPRCGSTDTRAYATKGKIQYRRCQMPVCRWTYTVIGQKI
jgi:hypothetical protein